MAGNDNNNGWERIQLGVKATERLLKQKDYNSAMIKARQTLEFMVKTLANRARLTDTGDLKAMIDDLYQSGWIDKTTCEHYHKIRMYGNQAAHDGDNTAFNANHAFQLLSQEVYTFSDGSRSPRRPSRGGGSISGSVSGSRGRTGGSSSRSTARSSASRRSSGRSAVSGGSRSRRRPGRQRRGLDAYDLLKLLIPVLCIILLFCVIKLVKPKVEEPETTAESPSITETVPETAPPETEPPTTEAPAPVYKTTTVLNVRSGPSTDSERIGRLEEGTTVEFVRTHDDEWTVITYEGQEAYVATQYLTTE